MYSANSNLEYDLSVSQSKQYLYLFILWPFLAFVTALINYKRTESKKVVYIFLIYYGLTFFISSEVQNDAYRYALALEGNAASPLSDFFKIVGGLYSDTSIDIVEPLVSFILSRITSFHGVYFAFWAALFGYFYLKSINLLYEKYRRNPGWNTMIYLGFFIMILPITAITGVRMWTAAWIFFYGSYHVILERNPRYLLLTLASSLVHWSFIAANVILIIYFVAGNRNIIYLSLTIISFVVPQYLTPIFESLSRRMGGAILNRYEGYTSEGYVHARQAAAENTSWFVTLGDRLVLNYLMVVIAIIPFMLPYKNQNKQDRNLFSFLLLFLAFVNFGKSIPSFGSRFQLVFYLFATLYIFRFMMNFPGNRIQLLTVIGIFPMLVYSAVIFRIGADSISAWLLAPGLGLPLLTTGVSLADILF